MGLAIIKILNNIVNFTGTNRLKFRLQFLKTYHRRGIKKNFLAGFIVDCLPTYTYMASASRYPMVMQMFSSLFFFSDFLSLSLYIYKHRCTYAHSLTVPMSMCFFSLALALSLFFSYPLESIAVRF